MPEAAKVYSRLTIQALAAIPVVGLWMWISCWLQTHTGMYGTSLIIAGVGVVAWLQGRVMAFWYLGLTALGLAYFLFEGEGFAVTKATDAFLLVTMLIASIALVNLIGFLTSSRRRLNATIQRLTLENQASDTLLREVSHRVGNDLATLMAIANLQASSASNEETVVALGNLRDRIFVFSSLYRRLNGGVRHISTVKFLEGICDDLAKAHLGLRPISLTVDVEPVVLSPHHAVMVGILLNESVTNALKYAFPDTTGGTITVRFHHDREHKELLLQVSDDGVGFGDVPKLGGMGRRIMSAMSAQLHGKFTLERVGNNTVATVRFPET